MENILHDFNEKVISLMTEFLKNSIMEGGLSNFTDDLNDKLMKLGYDLTKFSLEYAENMIFRLKERKEQFESLEKDDRKIVTIFGEIDFKRRYYIDKESKERIYLLDEYFKISPKERLLENVETRLIEEAIETNYEKAGKVVAYKTEISKQTVMNKISELKINIEEEKTTTKKIVDNIYCIADEDHVHLQKGGIEEPRLIVVYDSIEREGKRTRLCNKRHFGGVYKNRIDDLWEEVLTYLDKTYDLDKVKNIYILGKKMFEEIEEIYIENNAEGKKYKNIILPIIIGIVILMSVLFILRNIIYLYIASFATIFLMVILKILIHIKTVKPKKISELIFMRKLYKRILYSRTKVSIEKLLKQKNSYNCESVNTLINYYKDFKAIRKIDIPKICNWIVSFLSVLGVLVTVENTEFMNELYKIIFCILVLIVVFFIENKLLDMLSDGILESKVNFKHIYKIFNEIYLDIISDKEKKEVIETMEFEKGKSKYTNKMPTSDEFNDLTEAVGWGRRDNKIVEEALNNTLYSLCVYDGDKLIGYGRIIGDKTIFLYIHDVMVIPEYQGKQIGTGIMKELLKQIDEYKKVNPNIRTYLGASKGKEEFYEKFGFISRPNEYLGAGMILYNK